ncbi:hypothetical protein ABT297_41205 [Dactylosporangium sp. NPDC000555]|uniref:hypothetical protein n=1 Tax=Dactylosporangium sp. NPDC000555 TaxID=3154260 RepID=UPI00331774AD
MQPADDRDREREPHHERPGNRPPPTQQHPAGDGRQRRGRHGRCRGELRVEEDLDAAYDGQRGAGLSRAGVVGWWTVPAVVLGYAGLLFMPYDTPVLPAVGTLPMLAAMAFAGRRVLGRARVGAPAYPAAVAS